MEKNVTKFYVTNWEGRVGLDPNMYDVTNFSLFFLKASLRDNNRLGAVDCKMLVMRQAIQSFTI